MCIYCGTNKYRKIYENHHGPIPREDSGRTYDIHHRDGNHSNNAPDNLIAVSIYEHYQIHLQMGHYNSCLRMSNKMGLTPEEISNIAKLSANKRVSEGTHNFLGGDLAKKRVAEGTHNFLGGDLNRKRVAEGTHNFLGSDLNRKRVAEGTHNFLGGELAKKRVAEGTHHFLNPKSWKCEHCEKEGKGMTNYHQHHGDKCKAKITK